LPNLARKNNKAQIIFSASSNSLAKKVRNEEDTPSELWAKRISKLNGKNR